MTKDLTQGSPVKLILGFAVPLLSGMLFQQLYNLVDTLIVGRFLGVNALAGVGATGSLNFMVLGFCMGLCSGFAIPVARRFGAKEMSRMRQSIANGVWLSILFAAVITTLTVVFCRRILELMNTPQDCIQEAYDYISVIFAGIPFLFMYNLLSGYLRSLGDSKTPLYFLILSSGLNIALDLTFILIFDLGVMGASLATVISQGVSAVLCLIWIVMKFPILHITRTEWRVRLSDMRELCACGVPMGLQYSITAIGSIILQTAVNSLGSVYVASITAASRVLNFCSCPFEALGSTMATYAAQNVGAQRYERLNRGVISASIIGFVYSAVAFVLIGLIGPHLVSLFVSGEDGAQLIELAQRYMLVTSAFYPLLTLVNVVRFAIQGMGFSGLAVIAGIMEMFARGIAGITLVPALGFLGAALGSPLAWVFADVFLIPAFIRCRRALMSRVHHLQVEMGTEG